MKHPNGEGAAATSPKKPRLIKRLKGEANPQKVFRQGLLNEAETLRKDYVKSGPYQHIVIPSLVSDDLLRRVRQELLAIHATRKETDIYRVFQTGDLANLDGLPDHELKQLSNLLELRNALYSEEFRDFVGKVCGVGKLSPSKADLSHNRYKAGCHLLCHDDVIGTRSVSYIIYLTDPDHPWKPEDGGGLELLPVVSKGTPAVHPTVIIPPSWNQMAMFAVQPGHSFHSVAEVVSVDRDRPSISGWFHVMQPEDMTEEEFAAYEKEQAELGAEKATASLDQLMNDDGEFPFHDLPKFSVKGSHFQHPLNLKKKAKMKIQLHLLLRKSHSSSHLSTQSNERFCSESSIQLTSFLEPSLAASLTASTIHQDEHDDLLPKKPRSPKTPAPIANYEAGIKGNWTPTGPSHKHHLASIQHTLFTSKPFLRFLYLITSLKPTSLRSRIRRFRPGMDYTLATTSSANEDLGVLDATLCFVCERTKKDAEAWASDEVGGFDCYMAPDEGNEDPAQYRAQKRWAEGDGGALLSVSATSNCLNLVMREGEVMRFIKYVGRELLEFQYE
ncbi:hypothetical protein BCR33DRAFT_723823 [Rhizoclosmatium globosum]|uniref:uS12 prolyl 3,4-dihydroxylase n=1 Tax=Rhizoclosmatium globosum TaxID=329046 RepID=A0A1Y2BA78_9FUNG|nr:hypothetical protein BCR33DRAFT_723823 [Rhizoclosmatium globosum]|eukprot:ORY31748.1 hypothetical protein BCR33DRAFT_723823 [Rhizoclosmatium globosum]